MSNSIPEGGCSCGQARYQLTEKPLIVHACHCCMCQRLSGSTNAINLLIEAKHVNLLQGETTEMCMPTPSGHGQVITRCKNCRVAIWSNYKRFSTVHGVLVNFIRAGTLDHPEIAAPDVHIFTKCKLPYFIVPEAKPQLRAFYNLSEVWTQQNLDRLKCGAKPP